MKIIDPLAQSFYVSNEKGTFVTAVDLFFSTKDDTLPVTVQLRPMEGGIPSQKVYPFSEVVLEPKELISLMMLLPELELNSHLQFIWKVVDFMH